MCTRGQTLTPDSFWTIKNCFTTTLRRCWGPFLTTHTHNTFIPSTERGWNSKHDVVCLLRPLCLIFSIVRSSNANRASHRTLVLSLSTFLFQRPKKHGTPTTSNSGRRFSRAIHLLPSAVSGILCPLSTFSNLHCSLATKSTARRSNRLSQPHQSQIRFLRS